MNQMENKYETYKITMRNWSLYVLKLIPTLIINFQQFLSSQRSLIVILYLKNRFKIHENKTYIRPIKVA